MLKENLQLKQFVNPELASIKLLQRAYQDNGEVPEYTWRRIKDEETSLIAEGLKGHLNIPFDYQLFAGELRAADGQSFMDIAQNGLEYIEQQYYKDARYEFALTRAIHEYRESELAEQLANGQIDAQSMVTISPYPEEAADKYGDVFVRMLGAQPDRKLAMIRVIEKTDTGIKMHTRGIEESNLKKWNAILPPEQNSKTTDEMVGRPFFSNKSATAVLDELQEQYYIKNGLDESFNKSLDVWEFINNQTDLSDHFFCELNNISHSNESDSEMLIKLNTLRYNFWSALKLRYEAHAIGDSYQTGESVAQVFDSSGITMQQNREVFSACGMSIVPVEQMNTQQMSNEIFGGIMRCVTCPFCKKMVDAKVDKTRGTIECLADRCRAKVDSKGQRIDKNSSNKKEKTFTQLISEIFENLFTADSPKTKSTYSKHK